MSNWSLDLALMVPAPVYWAGVALAVVLVALLLVRRTRGALLRALSLAALLLALANPTLRQEERESLANIVIVVTDESLSQTIAGRPEQTAAIKRELETRLGEIPNLQVRWVSSSKPTGQHAAGTTLFADLNGALANTPPDRLAGVIMITDGQVHDVPKSAQALGFDAPVHALLTGKPGEFDRRIEIIKAPRYGIVGSTREIELKVVETGRKGRAGDRVTIKIRREGSPDTTRVALIGKTVTVPLVVPARGTEPPGAGAGDGARRADRRQQPRRRGGRRRAREPARAPGLGRAARRRARMAQPPEVRCRRGSRPLHHSASADEERRDADQRALADPVPDARAVRREDQGLRPHHLRPLPAPRHPPVGLLREHRPLRAGRRRAAGRLGRRLRRQGEPRLHRARLGAAGHADGPADRAPLQGEAVRRRRQAPGDARAARVGGEGPAVGPLVPAGGGVARPRPRAHARRRRSPAAGPRPQGQGPRGTAALRPCLAVGARLRGRRAAHGSAAPAVALAHEGAGPGGGAAAGLRQGPQAHRRAPVHGGGGGGPRAGRGPGRGDARRSRWRRPGRAYGAPPSMWRCPGSTSCRRSRRWAR